MKEGIPQFIVNQIKPKSKDYCVGIPILNEGDRIKAELNRMLEAKIHEVADIVIFDGGSTDGVTNLEYLKSRNITALLTKTSSGKLGAQLRMGYHYVIEQGYKGLVNIDGNNKDSVEDIPKFIKRLEEGVDFIQGSRYIEGGEAINTPLLRHLAVKYIHSVWISLLSGFCYTDTTNGFRGIKTQILKDDRLALFRDIFSTYEILFYMSVKIPQLGYRVEEQPVTRIYPEKGKVPTKISFLGNIKIVYSLFLLSIGKFNA